MSVTNDKPRLFTKRLVSYTNKSGWIQDVLYEIQEDEDGRFIVDSDGTVDRESEFKTPFMNNSAWQLVWVWPNGTQLEVLE